MGWAVIEIGNTAHQGCNKTNDASAINTRYILTSDKGSTYFELSQQTTFSQLRHLKKRTSFTSFLKHSFSNSAKFRQTWDRGKRMDSLKSETTDPAMLVS